MDGLFFPKPVRVKKPRKPLRSRRHTATRTNKEGHEFLFGIQAHIRRRIQIFERAKGKVYTELDAEGNIEAVYTAEPAICEVCEEGHQVSWEDGHWAHIAELRHCDCLDCGRFSCKPGHAKLHHNRIKWD